MQLNIAELLAGQQLTGLGTDFEVAVAQGPFRVDEFPAVGATAGLRPVGEILAVVEDDGVGWRRAGDGPRGHHRRMRPGGIVDVPGHAGQHGSVGKTQVAGFLGLGLGLGKGGSGNGGECGYASDGGGFPAWAPAAGWKSV